MATESQIQTTHIQNADTASAVIAAASAGQRIYVIAVYYRNGTVGALTPVLTSNAKTMWGGAPQATLTSAFYLLGGGGGFGLPVSDGVAFNVTFLSTASATSDLTVWWYYGP